jgi:predicted alpha/beta-hydrolase family hydrolase
MKDIASRLASRGIDVVTFNFLYSEAGRKMPDRVSLLEDCFRAAVATVRARGGLHTERLFIGGKSMGGRIATHVADRSVSGVVLLGYPLHPPGKKTLRDDIKAVKVPMLVVQGTRDAFGTAAEVKKYVASMPRARVHAVDDGDHSLVLPKSLGSERQEQALDGAADAIRKFVGK